MFDRSGISKNTTFEILGTFLFQNWDIVGEKKQPKVIAIEIVWSQRKIWFGIWYFVSQIISHRKSKKHKKKAKKTCQITLN